MSELLATIVISTFNRAAALPATLAALARQDIPCDQFEVIVVDDGSSDETPDVLAESSMPYPLRVFRQPENRGVSAGRNVGLRAAHGRYVIMVSDDVIVPPDFIARHLETHARFSGAWVVGGFSQLQTLTDTPFGRYLQALEERFERARLGPRIEHGLYAMRAPTARNLSLPREDLDRIGLFDERFRVCCEDQDLAERAAREGVRFLYNEAIECVHNDQAADLERYCRFQQRGARDTALLWAKYPEIHGESPIVRLNGPITRSDRPRTVIRKLAKSLLSRPAPLRLITRGARRVEAVSSLDATLHPIYRLLIGLHIFAGFRAGVAELGPSRPAGGRGRYLKAALKRLRAMPAVNGPLTRLVRDGARKLGITPELAVKHLPRVGLTTMRLPGERAAVMWSRGDDWVPNQVFWRGWDGYEPEVTPLFWKLAERAAVVLDIGAHVGFYSILAARANALSTVVAFEPLPVVFERLRLNLSLNRLDNVIAIEAAVAAADGTASFYHVAGVIPCSSSLSRTFMSGAPSLAELEVAVVSIDSFLRERKIDRVDLIKLDTETTEHEALAGMAELLGRCAPDIICEVLPRADASALQAALAPHGYRFYLLTGAGPQPRSEIRADPRWPNYLFTTEPPAG